MVRLTPHQLEQFFPKADAAAIEDFFRAVRDLEDDANDDNFEALINVLVVLNDTLEH
jgi:hypothetical protein